MAQKRYTRERLEGIAADSAAKMKDAVPNGTLTWEYLHPGAVIKETSILTFLWKVQSFEHGDISETTARCNSVVERGVPFRDR